MSGAANSKIVLHGASNDSICVRADIVDTVLVPEGVKSLIAFSDGTLLSMQYVDHCWRIAPLTVGDDSELSNAQGVTDGTGDNGTDYAELTSTRKLVWMTVSTPTLTVTSKIEKPDA